MKKKSSIIKLSIIGVIIVLGFVLAFCPMKFGFTDYHSFGRTIKLGLDLKGGVYAVYEGRLKEDSDEDFNTALNATIAALQSTLNSKGYTEAQVQREGTGGNIRVSVPDVSNPQEVLSIIGNPAEIKFVLRGSTDTTVLTGKEVVSATAIAYEGSYAVSLSLNRQGADAFYKATSENIGSTMEIVKITIKDGEETVVSRPTIEAAIAGGNAVISGISSFEEADNLASQITAGKLSLNLIQKELSTVAATLGDKALLYGLIAGAIGLVLIMAFIIFLYGLFGVAGSIALLIYVLLMIFFLAVFPWVQLTLPGIAGILLSIGMAIDGNIIIYERIKDEYKNGKSILSSSYYGFRKSISAILDGNITTIIAAIVLLIFGTGAVQGFAITLLIGLVLAVFSSLVVTRGLVNYMVNINQKNANLYRLTRGEEYKGLSAESNSPLVEVEIKQETERKKEKEGGIA